MENTYQNVETNGGDAKLEEICRNELKVVLDELMYAGLVKSRRSGMSVATSGSPCTLSPNLVVRCPLPGSV